MSATIKRATPEEYAAERSFRLVAIGRVKRLRRKLRAEGVDEARVQRESHRFKFKLWRQEYGEQEALTRLHCSPPITDEQAAERLSWLPITRAQAAETLHTRAELNKAYLAAKQSQLNHSAGGGSQ